MKKLFMCMAVVALNLPAFTHAAAPGTVTQWSTIDALLKGHFQGSVTLAEVKRHGDFGLGTFEALDGELILLDGKMYRIDGYGKVSEPADTVKTPFVAVAEFKADIKLEVPAGLTLAEVQARVDAVLPSKNVFYAVRVMGKFDEVRTRSVSGQKEPYPTLAEAVKTQSLFTIAKTEGTLVGLWCPTYAKTLNVPGYHFHYLSADRTAGGHVLGLVTGKDVTVQVAVLRQLAVKLPELATFDALDLTGDNSKVLHAVESERK
ncbi:acetolactate decarboxylase [Rariglobus hedericola]|nr:acetolactate decarboxylase [Rariglobus hedericola]